MITFLENIWSLFESVGNAFVSAYEYAASGVSTLLGVAGILPSISAVLPSAFTGVVVAIVSVSLFSTLLLAILRRV